jgi:hypothetical protein
LPPGGPFVSHQKGITVKFTMSTKVPNGTVLKMGVQYRYPDLEEAAQEKVWTYVWLKAGGLWYGTGGSPQSAGWGAVEHWLGKCNRHVVSIVVMTDGETVYEAPAEDPFPRADETHPG